MKDVTSTKTVRIVRTNAPKGVTKGARDDQTTQGNLEHIQKKLDKTNFKR